MLHIDSWRGVAGYEKTLVENLQLVVFLNIK